VILPSNSSVYANGVRVAVTVALGSYDLPEPVRAEPIRLLNNAVYAVASGDGRRFVLRVHRPRYRLPEHTLAELSFLAAVHEPLARVGIRVPAPFRTNTGELSTAIRLPLSGDASEQVHCDLLTWVDGEVRRPGTGLGLRGVHRIGRAMAHLHRAAESFEPAGDFVLPSWDAEAMFTERSPYRPGPFRERLSRADLSTFDTVADLTGQIFETLGSGRDAFGLIHHDFILGNCHTVRTARGWSVGVIDFDECGWGHYLYDLAPVMGNLSDYPHFRQLRAAFLDGYRSVRPLSANLEAHLPVLMAARHAAQCLWAAGLADSNGSPEVDTADHIAYRMKEIRRCLAMRSPT
jgi:Ser/Thr protein kinase RdoA (MazF antagonist)